MICGLLNAPPPHSKYNKHELMLSKAVKKVCENSMANAAREAIEENEGSTDLAVALDGSWQKGGFSSLNGVVSATSVDTGKVCCLVIFT